MLTRVVENIQVQITSIHVRVEDTRFFGQPLSMGITLQRLFIQSTDAEWQPRFLDRTVEENRHEPLRKLIQLDGFGIYCEPREKLQNLISLIEGSGDTPAAQL